MYILSDIFKGNFPVSQSFGNNPAYYGQFYIYGVKMKGHEGVDFATPVGTPILAPFDGIVLRQDYQSDFANYGKIVVLWDKVQKCAVWFCHLNDENTSTGQSFKKGDVLGHTGNTGNTTGPHLHFGMVETDAYGNRLHAYDGYGGFIDSMGPLVRWELGTTPAPQPNADVQVNIAKNAMQSALNATVTGSQIGDPAFKSKMATVKSQAQQIINML